MTDNEEDTKLHLITPSLQSSGWIGPKITMEYPISAAAQKSRIRGFAVCDILKEC